MKTWKIPQTVKINSLGEKKKEKKRKSASPSERLQLLRIGSISPDGTQVSASALSTQSSFTINGEKWAPPAGNCSHLEVVA